MENDSAAEVLDTQAGRIVVGYDGSAPGRVALDWAAGEARRAHRPLTVLHVSDPLAGAFGLPPARFAPGADVARAPGSQAGTAETGARRARERAPGVDVAALAATARVATTLVRASRSADLLVLGTHGHVDPASGVLGSVAYAVAVHALCPVVVARGDAGRVPGPTRPVVVGVDGSSASGVALAAAAEAAERAGAELIVVTAYPARRTQPWTDGGRPGESAGDGEFADLSKQAADAVAAHAAVAATANRPDLKVTPVVVEGAPGQVLVDVAQPAALLVLGSRGWGGVLGMLGSATHWAVHRASCPVMVVPRPSGRPASEISGFPGQLDR
ncbi:universal stress protein [Spongisporangium articulatum]|uniref:Universal stress protein n=1 Tax=Spongisporangium articulatum TaxID=3362603 RepID=A0ABW8ALY6_9ACTN